MKRNWKRSILVVSQLVLLSLLVFAAAVHAQAGGYPKYSNLYVNDFANALTADDTASIRQMFSDLKNQTSIEAVVVTIGSVKNYPTHDATIEAFSTHLFNQWHIGDAKKNNGVLILVAVYDHECQITLGSGFDRSMNAAMQQVIDQNMVPYFKNYDYSRGITAGARGVIRKLTGKAPGGIIVSTTAWIYENLSLGMILLIVALILCIGPGISCIRSGKFGWGWVFFTRIGAFLFGILRILWAILTFIFESSENDNWSSSGRGRGGFHSSGRRSSGGGSFGGGRSSGGGAHGKW
jgi:uncharacterized membrane protein YgcG